MAPRAEEERSARSMFAPVALQRPKSAMTMRVKHQLSQIKSSAVAVSMAALRAEQPAMNDLTTERLQLENDSNLQVRKLKEDRVAEMIDINTRRYRKYNQQRLQSDQKEATLTKMIFELEALQSAKAREEKSSKVEDLASGVVYCKIIDSIYPGTVPMSKVKKDAKIEVDFIHNFKILQTAFAKKKIDRYAARTCPATTASRVGCATLLRAG